MRMEAQRGINMVNVVIALEGFGICLTFIALILLLNGEGAREQKFLIFIMCGALVQNVGYLLELTAPTVEAAVTAVTVENVGSAFVPLFYCWFTYLLQRHPAQDTFADSGRCQFPCAAHGVL